MMRDVVENVDDEDPISAMKANIAAMFSNKKIKVEHEGLQMRVPVRMGHQEFPLFCGVASAGGDHELLMRVFFQGVNFERMPIVGIRTFVSSSAPSQKGWDEGLTSDPDMQALVWEFSRFVTILTVAEAVRQVYRSVESRLPHIDALLGMHKEVYA